MSGEGPRERIYSAQAIHLVRTATQTNLVLSQMADQKASLLMGANFLVFTIVMGQMTRGTVPWSLVMLAGFAFASAFCAVIAVLPATRGRPADPAAAPNLLFFGVFTAMPEEDWTDAVLDRLETDESVLRTMLNDLYQNGEVLQRKKYRLLGWAYRLLLAGLIVTALTFAAELAALPGAG